MSSITITEFIFNIAESGTVFLGPSNIEFHTESTATVLDNLPMVYTTLNSEELQYESYDAPHIPIFNFTQEQLENPTPTILVRHLGGPGEPSTEIMLNAWISKLQGGGFATGKIDSNLLLADITFNPAPTLTNSQLLVPANTTSFSITPDMLGTTDINPTGVTTDDEIELKIETADIVGGYIGEGLPGTVPNEPTDASITITQEQINNLGWVFVRSADSVASGEQPSFSVVTSDGEARSLTFQVGSIIIPTLQFPNRIETNEGERVALGEYLSLMTEPGHSLTGWDIEVADTFNCVIERMVNNAVVDTGIERITEANIDQVYLTNLGDGFIKLALNNNDGIQTEPRTLSIAVKKAPEIIGSFPNIEVTAGEPQAIPNFAGHVSNDPAAVITIAGLPEDITYDAVTDTLRVGNVTDNAAGNYQYTVTFAGEGGTVQTFGQLAVRPVPVLSEIPQITGSFPSIEAIVGEEPREISHFARHVSSDLNAVITITGLPDGITYNATADTLHIGNVTNSAADNYRYTVTFTGEGGTAQASGWLEVVSPSATQVVDGKPSGPDDPVASGGGEWLQWLLRFGAGGVATVTLSGALNEARKKCTDDHNEVANAVSAALGLGFNFGILPDYDHGAKPFKDLMDGMAAAHPALQKAITKDKVDLSKFANELATFVKKQDGLLRTRSVCLWFTSCFTRRHSVNVDGLAQVLPAFLAENYAAYLSAPSSGATSGFTRSSTFFGSGGSQQAGGTTPASAANGKEGYPDGGFTGEGAASTTNSPMWTSRGEPGSVLPGGVLGSGTSSSDSLELQPVSTGSSDANNDIEGPPPPPPFPVAFG